MSNGKPKMKKLARSEGSCDNRSLLKPLNYQAHISGLNLYNY